MITDIINTIVVLDGAVSYAELRNMPLPELFNLQKEAKRINEMRKAK
jgi:hypothetical protein